MTYKMNMDSMIASLLTSSTDAAGNVTISKSNLENNYNKLGKRHDDNIIALSVGLCTLPVASLAYKVFGFMGK